MKKLGFTLAEVLITLSIVGVVAAITIPSFVSNARNQANASKLSSNVAAIENAYTTMMAAESANDITETPYYKHFIAEEYEEAMAQLSKYLKIDSSSDKECITKTGSVLTFEKNEIDVEETTANANGFTSIGSIGSIAIDVNGKTNPNMEGRDKFYFLIAKNGTLYPAGGKVFTLLVSGAKTWSETGTYSCTSGNITKGCTARLVEEEYKVNY